MRHPTRQRTGPVYQRIGADSLQVEANSYLELLRIVCMVVYILGKKRGYARIMRVVIRSAWNGDLKITDAGRINFWRYISFILFIEKMVGLMYRIWR